MVSTRRHDEQQNLLQKLRNQNGVISVQADDRAEAVAFIVASLIDTNALDLLDKTLVATSPEARIPSSSSHLIVIADLRDGENPDFGDRRNLTIIRTYSKGRVGIDDSILLSHVPAETFRSELETMGMSRGDAESKALEVGHSVPILRRRLSRDPDIRRPIWARDHASAEKLIPFVLAGSWVEREDVDDRAVIELLGDIKSREVRSIRDELVALDDAPIARYGPVNVAVSQLDAIFAVGAYIKEEDLDRFFRLVPEILGDRDPALDLPEDQRWMANILGHARSFSNELLSGLSNALCILSVHGAAIFENRLEMNPSYRAEGIVRSLLDGADEDRWLSIRRHLCVIAETSPNAFLDCLDTELRKPEPAIRAIMGSIEGGISGDCLRANLFWALESLAWHPEYFARVAEIVFGLRRLEVKDRFSNSPKSTARSLFLAWLPATALGASERMAVLRRLSDRFRDPAMDVCISLLPESGQSFASETQKPKWRALNTKILPPTRANIYKAAIKASRLLLDMTPFDKPELEKLLGIVTCLHPDDFFRLVGETERWSKTASDEDKAELRHCLRRHHVRWEHYEQDKKEDLVAALHRMEAALEPQSPTARHRWLFGSSIEGRMLVEDKENERLSWQDQSALLAKRCKAALDDIREQGGDEAVLSFALSVEKPDLVVQTLIPQDSNAEFVAKWVSMAMKTDINDKSNDFLRQLLWSAGEDNLRFVTDTLVKQGILKTTENRSRFAGHLSWHPFSWRVAEELGSDVGSTFWKTVLIPYLRPDDAPIKDIEYLVSKLLKFQRPRSVFSAIQFMKDDLDPGLWIKILEAISRGEEPDGEFPKSYNLDEIFQYLDETDEVTDEQIAKLELPFVAHLSGYGYRNKKRTLALHRQLACDPSLFVKMLCWQYRRQDKVEEPECEKLPAENGASYANLAYRLLHGWRTVPGCDADGTIRSDKFNSWMDNALQLAVEVDRKEFAEIHLGELLANFARDRAWDDWLPSCILDYLDRPENSGLRKKFETGVVNARGATWRAYGGQQERHLAGKYRELATMYEVAHPRVSAMLRSIADNYDLDGDWEDRRAAKEERFDL
ncbi:MAG: hypothetical protein GDA55_00230 [Cellvibrionales bacterium]|nr:hypothetical protein [Cellvibrionales bacterium]